MGKYPNSDIHNKYSDWHWGLVKINDKYKYLAYELYFILLFENMV